MSRSPQQKIRELREALAAADERVREVTRELTALLDVSANLTSQLELQPLLNLIIQQVQQVADYARASIYLQEGGMLRLLASRSSRDGVAPPPASYQLPTSAMGELWEKVSQRNSVIIDDMHTDRDLIGPLKDVVGEEFQNAISNAHAQLLVPLPLKDRVIGMLTLTHEQPGFYNRHHAGLVSAICIQAAIAVENARLFEQAQALAAIGERQRLARELHDSVSQALYGIALGARTARTLLDRDPARAADPLDYVLSLAEAGQAEMRALLFELRPESLELEGLTAALQKQAAATAARYAIAIAVEVAEEPALAIAEKEVFYRVAQEALHNIVKHAHAGNATVRLTTGEGELMLEISDDGVGFDAAQAFPGHMGLVSMHERAASIGATLTVDSSPGNGTTVQLCKPYPAAL